MAEIKNIIGRQIFDSRGLPTVEVDVILASGVLGRASVPSGASKGIREALELRDGGTEYRGQGVLKALAGIQEIRSGLLGHDARHQKGIDTLLIALDGTPNKSRLGANVMLAVSLAVARAAAQAVKRPLFEYLQEQTLEDQRPFQDHQTQEQTNAVMLPVPLINIINGGAHADNLLDIQEFMIVPVGAATFTEALRYSMEVFHSLKDLLKQRGLSTGVGDEGGFAPNQLSTEAAIELILEAIQQAGFKAGADFVLALDLASSQFFKENHYDLKSMRRSFTQEHWIDYLVQLICQYPIQSLEDPMAEEDWAGWKALTERVGTRVQLVGDDLFVTHTDLIQRGVTEGAANAVLIKPNQIGTLTETRAALDLARSAGFQTILSHRSGETEDTFISDFAVGAGIAQIKTGSLSRSDRVAKYNQLLRIEESLGSKARFSGLAPFAWMPKNQ